MAFVAEEPAPVRVKYLGEFPLRHEGVRAKMDGPYVFAGGVPALVKALPFYAPRKDDGSGLDYTRAMQLPPERAAGANCWEDANLAFFRAKAKANPTTWAVEETASAPAAPANDESKRKRKKGEE